MRALADWLTIILCFLAMIPLLLASQGLKRRADGTNRWEFTWWAKVLLATGAVFLALLLLVQFTMR
ncbi:hypothetical protein [Nonomuraea endophytica]|uniref:Uncharacterized protein n=1 Tax=Nonomuraea endophytica TaxID=714136 RepID=A0A7W8EH60_9ACTN|nr:hypothetical protein [Nonomuraea endophytica]MBB5079208.1 hypothetical protein [Nonomuraea endophytica]